MNRWSQLPKSKDVIYYDVTQFTEGLIVIISSNILFIVYSKISVGMADFCPPLDGI